MDLRRLLAAWILRVSPAGESTRRCVDDVFRLGSGKAMVERYIEGERNGRVWHLWRLDGWTFVVVGHVSRVGAEGREGCHLVDAIASGARDFMHDATKPRGEFRSALKVGWARRVSRWTAGDSRWWWW